MLSVQRQMSTVCVTLALFRPRYVTVRLLSSLTAVNEPYQSVVRVPEVVDATW